MKEEKYDIPDFGPDDDTEDMPLSEHKQLPETTESDFPDWELYEKSDCI